MTTRNQLLDQIRRCLSIYADDMKQKGKVNRLEDHISGEDIGAGLMNLVYGLKLENANRGGRNEHAIDLVDRDADDGAGVAVQVTTTNKPQKVNHTMEGFCAEKEGKRQCDAYGTLMVLILTMEDKFKSWDKMQGDGYDLKILNLVDLSSDMEHLATDRLEGILAYLEKELGPLTKEARPKPRHLLPKLPSLADSFVEGSRDVEVEKLAKIVESGKPVFVWGLGGMGKTQVAIQLGKTLQQTRDVYFIHYTPPMGDSGEAMRETILRAHFAGYKFQGHDNESRDAEFAERMDILRREYAGAVLIIDNFDRPGKSLADLRAEKAYQELTQCGLTLVFTTRSEAPGVEICPLAEGTLLGMIRRNYRDEDVTEEQLLKLIRAVDGHTMMVDLLGKTLARSRGRVSVVDLLEAFGGGLDRETLPVVDNNHNQSAGQKRIYEHMKILFDVSVLAQGQREILRYATLLPEDGLDYGTFWKVLDAPLQKTLDDLVDSGWLQCREKRLMIHPVVREVCLGELQPSDKNCGEFLGRLWDLHDFRTFYDADIFLQLAQCFSVASERLDDREGTWALSAGWYWSMVGQAQMALTYELRMLQKREQNMPDSAELATACNNVAATYRDLGDHEKALEYALKALGIREKKLPPDHPDLARSYSNVAATYGALGDREKALEYDLKALGIREKKLPPDHPDLATSYNNVAATYGELGDHERALEYMLKALGIWEKKLPPDHPDLARSYNNVASTYYALGDHEKELEYNLKALGIREKKLPPDHPDLALSYNNVAGTYYAQGDHERALEYMLKALGIWEKKLPPDHPDLATSYNNVAATYGALGDHEKELEYDLKALGIREKKLPPDHPDLATSYNNIGITYASLGEYQWALEYLEKALAIREKKLPAGHPYTEGTRRSIAAVKEKMAAQEHP